MRPTVLGRPIDASVHRQSRGQPNMSVDGGRHRRSVWRLLATGVMASLLVAVAAATTASAKTASRGAVVTYAEQPDQPPTYILPLESSPEESNENFGQFGNLMYPPLYAFDDYGQPALNQSLSIADPPAFSQKNTVVTINLKHWVWSNGAPVTGRDVTFWLNLLSAVTDPNAPSIGSSSAPGPGWGFSVAGGFPTNVVTYQQTGTYTVVLHLNASYNPVWFLYNELSQITPIPQAAWDRLSLTGPNGNSDLSAEARVPVPNTSPVQYVPGDPGSGVSGALGVAQFLNQQSQDTAAYSTDTLWRVVDGPFKMTQFNTNGFVKFVPNHSYSGAPKPRVSAFEEVPFTSDASELEAVLSGSVSIGYIPPEDISQKASITRHGDYSYSPWFNYEFAYASYNFTNPTTGPIFKQLYFRQAFQSLVNQAQYIAKFDAGLGTATTGPVPTHPANKYASPLEKKGEVYPFDPAKAVSLLKTNGWTVRPGGSSFCAKPGVGPGECGPGVKLDQKAAFTFLGASGNTVGGDIADALQSTAREYAGIDLTVKLVPFTQVIGTEFDDCTPQTPCAGWDVADLFVGWTYAPDYLPTGEELFSTGAGSNSGDYSSPTNDANTEATSTAPNGTQSLAALFKYEDFLARQLPVVWMPDLPVQLTVYKRDLHGVLPQGIIDQIVPQFYSLSG